MERITGNIHRFEKKTSTIEKELNDRGWILYGTVGNSMYPALQQKKTAAIIRKREKDPNGIPKRPTVGDVVLFKRNGSYILHRIVKLEGDRYGITGDNRWRIEHGVQDEQIIGIMTGIVRDGKETPVTDRKYQEYVVQTLNERKKKELRHLVKKIFKKLRGLVRM